MISSFYSLQNQLVSKARTRAGDWCKRVLEGKVVKEVKGTGKLRVVICPGFTQ